MDTTRDLVEQRIRAATQSALATDPDVVEVALPQSAEHGDFSTNLAMKLAGALKRPPRDIANALVTALKIIDAEPTLGSSDEATDDRQSGYDRYPWPRQRQRAGGDGPAWSRLAQGADAKVIGGPAALNGAGALEVAQVYAGEAARPTAARTGRSAPGRDPAPAAIGLRSSCDRPQ